MDMSINEQRHNQKNPGFRLPMPQIHRPGKPIPQFWFRFRNGSVTFNSIMRIRRTRCPQPPRKTIFFKTFQKFP